MPDGPDEVWVRLLAEVRHGLPLDGPLPPEGWHLGLVAVRASVLVWEQAWLWADADAVCGDPDGVRAGAGAAVGVLAPGEP